MTYNPEYYYLDVATDINFTSFVSGYENKIVTGTAHEVTDLTDNTTYYYRIRAKLPYNTTANSNTISVTTNVTHTEMIVFTSNRDGNYQIYSMNTDGSNQTRLRTNVHTEVMPFLNEAGDKLYFVSNKSGADDIYSMDISISGGIVSVSNEQRLTTAGVDSLQDIAIDDSNLLFIRSGNLYKLNLSDLSETLIKTTVSAASYGGNYIFANSGSWDIHRMDLDGNNFTTIYNPAGTVQVQLPKGNSSGTDVVFLYATSGGAATARVDKCAFDGSSIATVINTNNRFPNPTFSYDDQKILYLTKNGVNQNEINVCDYPSGNNPTNLSNNSTAYSDTHPFWGRIAGSQ